MTKHLQIWGRSFAFLGLALGAVLVFGVLYGLEREARFSPTPQGIGEPAIVNRSSALSPRAWLQLKVDELISLGINRSNASVLMDAEFEVDSPKSANAQRLTQWLQTAPRNVTIVVFGGSNSRGIESECFSPRYNYSSRLHYYRPPTMNWTYFNQVADFLERNGHRVVVHNFAVAAGGSCVAAKRSFFSIQNLSIDIAMLDFCHNDRPGPLWRKQCVETVVRDILTQSPHATIINVALNGTGKGSFDIFREYDPIFTYYNGITATLRAKNAMARLLNDVWRVTRHPQFQCIPIGGYAIYEDLLAWASQDHLSYVGHLLFGHQIARMLVASPFELLPPREGGTSGRSFYFASAADPEVLAALASVGPFNSSCVEFNQSFLVKPLRTNSTPQSIEVYASPGRHYPKKCLAAGWHTYLKRRPGFPFPEERLFVPVFRTKGWLFMSDRANKYGWICTEPNQVIEFQIHLEDYGPGYMLYLEYLRSYAQMSKFDVKVLHVKQSRTQVISLDGHWENRASVIQEARFTAHGTVTVSVVSPKLLQPNHTKIKIISLSAKRLT